MLLDVSISQAALVPKGTTPHDATLSTSPPHSPHNASSMMHSAVVYAPSVSLDFTELLELHPVRQYRSREAATNQDNQLP
jgi:hypothetical protein